MEPWLNAEIRARREAIFAFARRSRQIRLARGDRSTGLRARVADATEAIGAALLRLAGRLRGSPVTGRA